MTEEAKIERLYHARFTQEVNLLGGTILNLRYYKAYDSPAFLFK